MANVSSSTKNKPSTNCSPSNGKTEKAAPAPKESPASQKGAQCSQQGQSRQNDCVKLSREGKESEKSETVDNVARGLASWAETEKNVNSKAGSELQKNAASGDGASPEQSTQPDGPKLDLAQGEFLSRGADASPRSGVSTFRG